jgi:adenine/guanine phosphoribosyltransferase-like PRPP-binding protein
VPADRLGELQFKIMVVEALRAVKSRYSYRTLARILEVNHTLLARYVAGSLLPSERQAERIWERLKVLVNIEGKILEGLEREGFIDLTPLLSEPLYLRILSLEFLERFSGERVSKILVPETSGITLATSMALAFNVPLVIARRRKSNPHIEYIEASTSMAPNIARIFYIPAGSIRGGERVLIVDDIIQTGLTLGAMRILVEKSGAELAGVAAVVVYGGGWRGRAGLPEGVRVESIIEVPGSPTAHKEPSPGAREEGL